MTTKRVIDFSDLTEEKRQFFEIKQEVINEVENSIHQLINNTKQDILHNVFNNINQQARETYETLNNKVDSDFDSIIEQIEQKFRSFKDEYENIKGVFQNIISQVKEKIANLDDDLASFNQLSNNEIENLNKTADLFLETLNTEKSELQEFKKKINYELEDFQQGLKSYIEGQIHNFKSILDKYKTKKNKEINKIIAENDELVKNHISDLLDCKSEILATFKSELDNLESFKTKTNKEINDFSVSLEKNLIIYVDRYINDADEYLRNKIDHLVTDTEKLIEQFDEEFKIIKVRSDKQINKQVEETLKLSTKTDHLKRIIKDEKKSVFEFKNKIKKRLESDMYSFISNTDKRIDLKIESLNLLAENYKQRIKDVDEVNRESLGLVEKKVFELENVLEIKNELVDALNLRISELESTKKLKGIVNVRKSIRSIEKEITNNREDYEDKLRKLEIELTKKTEEFRIKDENNISRLKTLETDLKRKQEMINQVFSNYQKIVISNDNTFQSMQNTLLQVDITKSELMSTYVKNTNDIMKIKNVIKQINTSYIQLKDEIFPRTMTENQDLFNKFEKTIINRIKKSKLPVYLNILLTLIFICLFLLRNGYLP